MTRRVVQLDRLLRGTVQLDEPPALWEEGLAESAETFRGVKEPPWAPRRTAETARWLGLSEQATAALIDASERWLSDEAWGLLAWHLYRRWIADGPGRIEEASHWPRFTEPAGLMLYGLLCVSGVPHGRALLERRGLPPGVVRDSFNDVGKRLETCRRAHGCWGVANPRWLGRHLHGRLVELGRLQYEVGRLADKLGSHADAAMEDVLTRHGLRLGEAVWWVHIPAGAPLTPGACDASLARARGLLRTHFPEHDARAFACCSWMLDDQLREYLPAESNLLRFRERFEVVATWPDDAEFHRWVGGDGGDGASKQPSRLQLAAARHRERGGVWHAGLGIIDARA